MTTNSKAITLIETAIQAYHNGDNDTAIQKIDKANLLAQTNTPIQEVVDAFATLKSVFCGRYVVDVTRIECTQ